MPHFQNPKDTENYLHALLKQRVGTFDGGMGTRIQKFNLSEADFRGMLQRSYFI